MSVFGKVVRRGSRTLCVLRMWGARVAHIASLLPESFVFAAFAVVAHRCDTVFPANKFVNNIENSADPITAATTTKGTAILLNKCLAATTTTKATRKRAALS